MTVSVDIYPHADRTKFEHVIVPRGQPAVMPGVVSDWPVVRAARTSDAALSDELRRLATDAPGEAWFSDPALEGRFGFDPAFTGFNHERKLATVAQLLDLLMRQSGKRAQFGIYAGALPTASHLPTFHTTHAMPLIDRSPERLVSLWLGNRTHTAAHFDFPHNLACVVAGRRRFTLFPIEQIDNLYIGPIDFTLAGQPSSLVNVDEPDFARFPRFREALRHARSVVLEPGDVLYIPSLWWHAVDSLDEISAMVNYWWHDEAMGASPFSALLHSVMMLRALPEAERALWQILFDHYAFSGTSDPVGHLPADARGVLDPADKDAAAAMRKRLVRSLGGR